MSVELVQLYDLNSSTVLGPDLLGPSDEDPVQHSNVLKSHPPIVYSSC